MRTDDFAYTLPPELIAQTPVEPRDASRLLLLDRAAEHIEHHIFHELPELLRAGDLLVVNDTRVLRARLRGRLAESSGAVELLLLRDRGGGLWECLARPGRRLRAGRRLLFGSGDSAIEATVEAVTEGGERLVRFPAGVRPDDLGDVPLPPYIHETVDDGERYQTVYAREPGSAAAPTAGLHFTPSLLDRLAERGIARATVTLHIGPGTFRPVSEDDPLAHEMHAEFYHLSEATAAAITATRAAGGRVVCVGTTAVRTLEQAAANAGEGPLHADEGWTRLFILPGYRYRLVDALITNFHLPRSTLLMLVSAFAGHELTMRAYEEAVRLRYRFYSFGDAMLIV